MEKYANKIGTVIYGRDRSCTGVITNIVRRWCGGCQCVRSVYSVKWNDGIRLRTFPCPAGCQTNADGTEQIV